MINNFNKQLIQEYSKLGDKFDTEFVGYRRLFEQDAPAPDAGGAAPPPDAGGAPAPDMGGAPGEAAPAEPKEQTPMEKPYAELLIIIANALKVNLLKPDENPQTEDFNSYKELSDFAETWSSNTVKAEQVSDSEAVKIINNIQSNLKKIMSDMG